MKVLLADDHLSFRRIPEMLLAGWGYEVVTTDDGSAALEALLAPDGPPLAILDWMMPGLDGPEVCRRARAAAQLQPRYLILLTAKHLHEDIVAGLDAGANDFVIKPFQPEELLARLRVGVRVVELQQELVRRVGELQEALAHIKTLRGLLPICCYCKKIRDDKDYWQQLESYITDRSDATFTHGICPECYAKHVEPTLAQLRDRRKHEDT